MEGGLEILEGGTGPRVTAEMKGVLVALGFVFVFETVIAVLTCVLLFHLVGSAFGLVFNVCEGVMGGRFTGGRLDCRTSWVS
jgi:hypothetical protein